MSETDPAAPAKSGHPDLDHAINMLANVAALPLAEQPARYDDAHRAVQEALARGTSRRSQPDE